jgi:hypothetical protein
MLLKSSLIFDGIGWGLITWIALFWFLKIGFIMFLLDVL